MATLAPLWVRDPAYRQDARSVLKDQKGLNTSQKRWVVGLAMLFMICWCLAVHTVTPLAATNVSCILVPDTWPLQHIFTLLAV